jgi:CheY-like chemotaxis protein
MSAGRILVVEDHPLNRKLLRDLLGAYGFAVVEAEDVARGRAILAAEVPSLVLMDVRMPGEGGEVLLREIRADERLRGIPVVAVTAQAMDGDRQRLLDAGFDDYVSKPIDTRTLPALVRGWTLGR